MDGFPPPPSLTKRNSISLSQKQATAPPCKGQSQSLLSAAQKGLLPAKERDLDALRFRFPVARRERLAPGVDPNHPEGVYEPSTKTFPLECSELKQAVQN